MAHTEATAQRAPRVLVVDDEMHLRLFIKAVFESDGYETAAARDGDEGLRKAREFRPDLVSLDLMMPGQGGIRLLTELRRDPELATIKVLVVSAVEGGTFDHSLALLSAGPGPTPAPPEGYVEKPPTPQSLLDAARRILNRSGDACPPRFSSNPQSKEANMAKKIMVVDDDPDIVEYLLSIFTERGYDTCSASGGEQAWEVMQREHPDLITLDLEMPDEWGPRLYRRFSQKAEFKNLPVVVISGLAGIHLAIHKAVATVNKPFEPQQVLDIVERTIGKP